MNKKTLIAVSVFGLLLLVGLFNLRRKPERGISRVSFTAVKTDAVSKVVISGKTKAELVKDGDEWKLAGKLADKNAVTRLIESVSKINSSDLVTKSDSRFGELEVDDDKGTKVSLWAQGKNVAEFVVGKASAGGANIRAGDEVFAVKGVFPGAFTRETTAWLEKKLFQVTATDVDKVSVKLGDGQPYELAKKDDTWGLSDTTVLPEGFRFDASSASRVATSLANLRAKEILESPPSADATGFDAPIAVLTFAASGSSKTGTLTVGKDKEAGKETYIKVTGRDDVMTVHASSLKPLLKKPTDFRDLKAMSFDATKVKSVKILDGANRLRLDKKDGAWVVADAKPKAPKAFEFDPTLVSRRIGAAANFRGQAVAEVSLADAGLTKPKGSIELALEDGTIVKLRFGEALKSDGKDQVYVQGNVDDLVYVATSFQKKNLLGLVESFKKQAPPPQNPGMGGMGGLDASSLSNLPPEIRKQLMEQMAQQRR